MTLSPYLRLMRLDKPVGIWLLMWPCWWSATLAAGGPPPWEILIFLMAGAFTMRAAGCIVNDLADRDLDKSVARTASRPLASGEISPRAAFLLLFFLLGIAALIACRLGLTVLLLSLAWLPLVAAYPFMKRITWWPQLFLGLTFNAGAIIGWAAVRDTVELPALLLYLGAICWTVGYDTIYAFQDIEDDARIGVKSTARLFGARARAGIAGFYGIFALMLVVLGVFMHANLLYYIILLFVVAHLGWQILIFKPNASEICLKLFLSNQWLGIIVWGMALTVGG